MLQPGGNAVKVDAPRQRSDVITSAAAFVGISVALIGFHFSPDRRGSSADDWAAKARCPLLVAVLLEDVDARRESERFLRAFAERPHYAASKPDGPDAAYMG